MGYPLLNANTADVSLGASTSPLTIVSYSIRPYNLYVGRVYHLYCAGEIVSLSGSPPSFRAEVQYAGATANIPVDLNSMTPSGSGFWEYEAWITCRAVGAGATILEGSAHGLGSTGVGSPQNMICGAVTTLDYTAAITLAARISWVGGTVAGSTANCKTGILEVCHT